MDPRLPLRAIKGSAVVAIGLGLAGSLSGCARDRSQLSSAESPGGRRRLARRPALEGIGPVKPLFVGGYAGADYNRETRPLRNRPMQIEPY